MEILSLEEIFEVKADETVLVEAKISLPQIAGKSKEALRINAYYKAEMRFWVRYAKHTFAKQAKKQYEFMTKNNFIFNTFSLNITYTVTLNHDETLSLYTDRYEYAGGANGVTVRSSDTWKNGYPMKLKILDSRKRKIRREITEEIKNRQSKGESYFEPVKRYVKKYYDPKQWYFTNDGITVYFQETTIAPHSSGIVTFLIKEAAP